FRPQNYCALEGWEDGGISGRRISSYRSHRHTAGSSLLRQRRHTPVRAAATAGGEGATGGGYGLAAELRSAGQPGAAIPTSVTCSLRANLKFPCLSLPNTFLLLIA